MKRQQNYALWGIGKDIPTVLLQWLIPKNSTVAESEKILKITAAGLSGKLLGENPLIPGTL